MVQKRGAPGPDSPVEHVVGVDHLGAGLGVAQHALDAVDHDLDQVVVDRLLEVPIVQ